MRRSLIGMMAAKWRLILLGATGIILSIASGWTTWDGMRNFTQEPLLAFMITFGIQGVMLITAWLIGESFAAGMGRAAPRRPSGTGRIAKVLGIGLGVALAISLAVIAFQNAGGSAWLGKAAQSGPQAGAVLNWYWLAFAGVLVIALLVLNAGRETIDGYLESLRVMVRNFWLWAMFLAYMATSVFFSFDSLFTTIFPVAERERAADVRGRSAGARIAGDIVQAAERKRLEAHTAFFQGNAWQNKENALDGLAGRLRAVPDDVERYVRSEQRKEDDNEARLQSRRTLIEKNTSELSERLARLSESAKLARGQAEQLAATTSGLVKAIFDRDRDIIAKAAEAEAEERGIGVTTRKGRGPKYRELAEQLRRLQETKANLELQLRAYNKRLVEARVAVSKHDTDVAAVKSQLLLAGGGELGKAALNGSAQRTKMAEALRSRASALLDGFGLARARFEQNPTKDGLERLQLQCTNALDFMAGLPFQAEPLDRSTCDAGHVHEAAARLYNLNVGVAALGTSCRGRAGPAAGAGIVPQLMFARDCLQSSGMSRVESEPFRAQINALERDRDDKA
ncbi:MAG TPA: hypothetical protein VMX97_12830, partial [Hyphomicrobiaceae bacterium]|nr:hypothetical protein [Hyphomicrobiaceae bacterium]